MPRLGQAWKEARTALGDRRARRAKARLAAKTLLAFFDRAEKLRRLARLRDEGLLDELPNDWQLLAGSYRMMVDFIIPGSARLYRQTGKSFVWQQVLRLLDEPCAVMDPTGLTAPEESIRSHLIQVTHHTVGYDVELLRMFPQGLERLLAEVRQLAAGTHPRQRAIEAIVEHPDYHRRLLEALERHIARPEPNAVLEVLDPPPGAEGIFEAAEAYATPASFFRYCASMPPSPLASVTTALRATRRSVE